MAIESLPEPSVPLASPLRPRFGFLTSTPIIATAAILLLLIIVMPTRAPWLPPHDPMQLLPAQRLKPPSDRFLLGTDAYGRDLLSRVIYGGPVSPLMRFRARIG